MLPESVHREKYLGTLRLPLSGKNQEPQEIYMRQNTFRHCINGS